MKKQIIASLLIASQAHAVLEPASTVKNAPTNDTFIGYQWPLMPMDQYTDVDLDDTHPKRIHVDPQFKIGWRNFDSLMKRDVIVAVVDSGLNVSHPELKDRLVPGFNFAIARPEEPTNIYDDQVGHGTHIAGIMAAAAGNQAGIAGLSGKIKIMPLKVYSNTEPRKPVYGSLIQRVIKAMEFAITNKADVINLSMGWPRIVNSPEVQAIFQKALEAGIVVVAAAGNNGHSGQIYPCAYKGVICVASMDLDGGRSNFSNFGGHVDIAAPGQEILSLIPQVLTSGFGPKGYEVKSGTSQAAPFISATAAILKGIYPNETVAQIRSRILLGSKAWNKDVVFGALDMEKAIQAKPAQIAAPVFKGVEVAEVDPNTRRFTLPLTIEANSSKDLQISVASSNPEIQLSAPKKAMEKSGETQYTIEGQVSSLQASNDLAYTVTVNGKSYSNHILLQMPLAKLPAERVAFTMSDADMVATNDLLTVYDPRNLPDVAYWSYLKKENGVQLSVWTKEGQKLVEKSVLLPGISNLTMSLVAEDFDFDGVTDYMIMGILRDPTKTEFDLEGEIVDIRAFYLNADLKITSNFKIQDTGALLVPSLRDKAQMSFVKFNRPGKGPLKVPFFWSVGWIPSASQDPDYNRQSDTQQNRIYHLEIVNDSEMQIATHATDRFRRLVQEELNVSPKLAIQILATQVQSAAEAKAGKASLLFSVGNGVNTTMYLIPISDLGQPLPSSKYWKQLPQSQYSLALNSPEEAWDFSRGQIEFRTDFHSIYSGTMARSVRLKNILLKGLQLQLPARGDEIVDITKTFSRGRDSVTFYETNDFLRVQGTWNGKTVNEASPIYRSTFMPGQVFSQSFQPVVVSAKQVPGVLVNNSRIFSNTILIYSLQNDGKLVSSVGRTYDVPSNCVMRNPQIATGNFSKLSWLCKETNGFEIRFLDLN